MRIYCGGDDDDDRRGDCLCPPEPPPSSGFVVMRVKILVTVRGCSIEVYTTTTKMMKKKAHTRSRYYTYDQACVTDGMSNYYS